WQAEAGYRGLTAADQVHLRLHVLTACDDVALAAGQPPQNRPGNPKRIDYALLHRKGPELTSTFVTVIEPYRATPFIKSVQRLPANDDQVGLRIELADGTVDRVWFNPSGTVAMQSPEGDFLSNGLGFVRDVAGVPQAAVLIDGRKLVHGPVCLSSPAALHGQVVAMNQGLAGGGWLRVNTRLPTDGSLNGRLLIIANHGDRDAAYLIQGIESDGDGSRIDCGPITFVRGFLGPHVLVRGNLLPLDYDHGYEFDFEPGDAFTIPLDTVWSAGPSRRPSG
ncbi:MAG: heparinase, partial [Opitutaceae bacterium]